MKPTPDSAMELHVTELAIEDHVGIIRLNRPGRGNSWTSRMNAEYRWLMLRLDRDPSVRVIVVTGTGHQFCVGADFKALDHHASSSTDYVEASKAATAEMAMPGYGIRADFDHDMVWHWGLSKTVICAINGACAGIAVSLAAFCDLRYAVEGAKFTTATPKLGLPAEYGISWLLPRIVGLTHAADILLTGRIFSAEEALAMGLLNGVFAREEFESRVIALAKSAAQSVSPIAAKTAKRQLYAELLSHDIGQSIEGSKALTGQLLKHPDHREGALAMKEKRLPKFSDPA